MSRGADTAVIERTEDLAASLALAREAQLEVTTDDEPALIVWGAFARDRMVGTVSLNTIQGLACIGRIAVTGEYRGQGLGARLLDTLEAEARQRGLRELWATARAPGFFLAQGYVLVTDGPERELLLSGCASCRQRDVTCRPQAVWKTMTAEEGDQ